MGIFNRFLGKKKTPKCSSCGQVIHPSTTDWQNLQQLARLKGWGMPYRGVVCENCSRLYCLTCHDFAKKGPFCPSCRQPKLLPLFENIARELAT